MMVGQNRVRPEAWGSRWYGCDKTAHLRCIQTLVAHADSVGQLDLPNGRGTTPLQLAVTQGNEVVVKALLQARVGTQR